MDATQPLFCDCCQRTLTVTENGFVGHQSGGWRSAKGMLFGKYWCADCAAKRQPTPAKPDWLKTPRPLFKAAESFRLTETLSGWLTRLQPLYDRSGWDYSIRSGWQPKPATRAAFSRVGPLLIESGNLSLTLKPLDDAGKLGLDRNGNWIDPRHKTPEYLWEHFGKSLSGLFRNLQPADAKRLRTIWKTF